ncbi:uncharacterized protein LOC129612359 [Condylostylus longicornis]|uniref:uncharacterized protein LOC129612359 n=1 Tax=Condylostylus longicornis TaxID=2530218 RepID=UPI00244DB2BB|nr:uncharacterized protein LOC129612359 [Condylostylus longicornis]
MWISTKQIVGSPNHLYQLFYVLFSIFFKLLTSPVFDGPQCLPVSGGSLPTTIREALDLIPLDDVVEIYMVAISNDKEVQEVMEFVQSDDFIKIVTAVNKHPKFHEVLKYACDELYLDAFYHLNIAHEYLGEPTIE